MHRVDVVPWSIAATYWVMRELPGESGRTEGRGRRGSGGGRGSGRGDRGDEGDQSGQRGADQRADHRDPRVAPVGAALAADRQHRVGDARPEVTGRVDGVAGRPTERLADTHDDRG